MLLATSCSKDELDTASSGNEAQVTFSLGLEGRIATRAISDGLGAKKLVYAVYNESGELISTIAGANDKGQVVKESAFAGGLTDNVTITLAKGQNYTVAFWAQNKSCTAYNTEDLKEVTVSYENGNNNDETRDAFFAAENFTVSGSTEIKVTLKRPFAQINVGVEQSDWENAVASGVTIDQSSVVIKNAATKIDLVTGKVSEPKDVTYNLATIPERFEDPEDLKVDMDGDGEKEASYKWLSMSYILVDDKSENGAAKAILEGLEFTFHPTAGKDIKLNTGLNSVPVQRNWRTNILGKLLTGDITFNIRIDPAYNEEDHNYNWVAVSSTEQLNTALNDPTITSIVLNGDIQINSKINITSDKEIDLNNKTLTTNKDIVTSTDGCLTLKNGTITQTSGKEIQVSGGSLILDGITYTATNINSRIYNTPNAQSSVIEIRNSDITGGYYAFFTDASTPVGDIQKLVLENSSFTAKETALVINIPVKNATVNNCSFTGGWQAAFIRGGEVNFTGCTFNLNMDPDYNDMPEVNRDKDDNESWYTGNQAEGAALLIGNRCKENAGGYLYPTSVTLENSTFSVSGTAKYTKGGTLTERTAAQTPSVYVWSRVEAGNGTTFNYDSDSKTSFDGAGKGLYIGNKGKNLTVNGSPYSAAE